MDYKYIPFYVQGNAVTGMYYGQWGMAEDRDIEYVQRNVPSNFYDHSGDGREGM